MASIELSPSKTHILAFPFPTKGHMNPMLHLCNQLASKGFRVTIITTISTYKDVKAKAKAKGGLINIESILDREEKSLKQLDMSVYFLKFRDSIAEIVAGIVERDLPGFEYFKERSGFVSKLLLDQFSNIDKIDYVLFNTFEKLEAEVSKWMASKWKVLTVGPIAPITTTTSNVLLEEEKEEENKNSEYLFETNTEVCMKWLDEREPNSVIYVSFGSVVSLTEEQMEEIAEGLLMSNFNFLWIVRDEERSKLPNDRLAMNNSSVITTSTGKSGLMVNWCPQQDVLSHGSVACFMTHCGWNSTLEAISSGVPMIAVPQWVDQTTNAKFIEDVWKIGVRVKVDGDGKDTGLVRREEIVRCVREMCESEKGKELKRNAMKWKNLAKEAVSEGGSSDRNLEEFALNLLFY